jgi:hypothetical protein
VAVGLGGLTGALLVAGNRVPPRFQVLVTVAASFSVSLVVFLLSRTGLDFDVAPSLIAPLLTLLPGALLTTAVIELSTGQMISGAGRLGAGAAQLVLLGLGILAAAALVGVPAFDLTATKPALGAVGPWLAVGVFGIGIVMNLCARPSSLGWILPGPVCRLRRPGAGSPVLRRRTVRLRGRSRDDPGGRSGRPAAHRAAGDRQLHTSVLAPGPRCPRPSRRRGPTQR